MNNQSFNIGSTSRSLDGISADDIAYGLWLEEPSDNKCEEPSLRDITLSWLRFGYQGPVIESCSIETILDRALTAGFKACVIQRPGNVIAEDWMLPHWQVADFHACLKSALNEDDFLVCANVIENEDFCALDTMCFLVNLEQYRALGRPAFGSGYGGSLKQQVNGKADLSDGLKNYGSGFVEASGKNGLALPPLPETLCEKRVKLISGVVNGPGSKPASGQPDLLNEKALNKLLEGIDKQISRGRTGVFLWNIESYDDLSDAEQTASPDNYISDLFCVAAGFKPNMLLQHHGFNSNTRVIFFDYSQQALTIRKTMIEEWDGADYPKFCRELMQKFPPSGTFYQLWNGLRPSQIDWADAERLWELELDRWGGARNFQDQWIAHQSLTYEFIHCDLLASPKSLLNRIEKSGNSVVWWSNAFFTISSNWLLSIEDRRKLFCRWIEGLAACSPECQIYGADYNNSPVNSVTASEYLQKVKKYSRHPHPIELFPPKVAQPLRF